MTTESATIGRSLCGDVRLELHAPLTDIPAPHCRDCARRGSVQVGVADQLRHPVAGRFDDAAAGEMKIEFYADMCPQGSALAGEHWKRSTTAELFAPSEGKRQ